MRTPTGSGLSPLRGVPALVARARTLSTNDVVPANGARPGGRVLSGALSDGSRPSTTVPGAQVSYVRVAQLPSKGRWRSMVAAGATGDPTKGWS
jgi:hypothetical protein